MYRTPGHTLRMQPDVYYIWVGGSCDYGHEERASAGAYIMQQNNGTVETYVISDDHTTEFRMILTVMAHALEVLPSNSSIVFLTNVSYILQNFDREPDTKSANPDLISRCRSQKTSHQSVEVKLVPFHKYPPLPETHDMAHQAMLEHRSK